MSRKKRQSHRPLGPAAVATSSLRPNPHNPRLLFDAQPLKTLEDSIRKVGILVPLTVFRAGNSNKYTILDGQRRWICAQEIGLAKVPINEVAEPSIAENIVTMFQIHKLRKDWELMPTALKLGVLMEEMQEKRDKQLAELTGLDVAVVVRCKKLLSFPKKYQEMMLFANPEERVKADFFIELYPILNDRLVRKMNWFNRDAVIKKFLHKYENKLSGFKSITDFRKIKQHLTVARVAGEARAIERKFRKFLNDDSVDISSLEVDEARIHRAATNTIKLVSRAYDVLDTLDVDEFIGEEGLWEKIEELYKRISKLLAAADRRIK